MEREAVFRWKPGRDTAIAFLTEGAMIAAYFAQSHLGEERVVLRFLVFVVFANLILNAAVPAYVVLRLRGEGLGELGITTRHWQASLAISIVLAAIQVPQLLENARSHPEVHLVPHLLFNGLIFWEVLFVFGWLQLRFERAFGVLPAVLLAGVCFGAYHVGTYPWNGAVGLMVWGVFFAAAFRLTRNLLTLFPLAWSVGSGAGTLAGDMVFDWHLVAVSLLVLAVQGAIMGALARPRRPRVAG